MLDTLLTRFSDVNKIEGSIAANIYLAGCRCYLGAAAQANFKFVQMASKKEECNEKNEFTSTTYRGICDDYQRKNCFGLGFITKN